MIVINSRQHEKSRQTNNIIKIANQYLKFRVLIISKHRQLNLQKHLQKNTLSFALIRSFLRVKQKDLIINKINPSSTKCAILVSCLTTSTTMKQCLGRIIIFELVHNNRQFSCTILFPSWFILILNSEIDLGRIQFMKINSCRGPARMSYFYLRTTSQWWTFSGCQALLCSSSW